VEELHVDAHDLLVVPLDLAQLVGDVLAVVIGHFDIATLDNDVHALASLATRSGWAIFDRWLSTRARSCTAAVDRSCCLASLRGERVLIRR